MQPTDMVEFEATRLRSSQEDAQRIADFLTRHAGRIVIQQTSFGRMAIAAAQTFERYAQSQQLRDFYANSGMTPPPPLAPNSGEIAVYSYVAELIAQAPGPPCLVIAEDDFFLRSTPGALPGNAHIISTARLLGQIEALDPRIKALDILEAARQYKGRDPNRLVVDATAAKIKGESSWTETTQAARLKGMPPKKFAVREITSRRLSTK